MFAVNKEEFLANEKASKDTIDVKRIYIDMAGDLVGGVLLSQIVFWHLPGENGNSKLRVYHKGEYWIARGREDYWDDCRLTAKQFDRAIKELEELNLVVTDVLKFNGSPMKHVRIDWEVFLASYDNLLKAYGENGYSPKGNNHIPKRGKSLTESTSETTSAIPPTAEIPPSQEKPADPPTVKAAKARIAVAAVEGAVSAGKRRGVADPRQAAKDEREAMQGDVVRVWTQGGQVALPDVTSIAHKIALDHYAAIESGTITREQWRGAIENLMNGGGGKYRNGGVKDAWVVGNDIDNLIRAATNSNNDAAIKARLMAA